MIPSFPAAPATALVLMGGLIGQAAPAAARAGAHAQPPGEAAGAPRPAGAESPAGAAAPADEILVVGIRQRGTALSGVPPEIVLSADDLAVTGSGTFEELLAELGSFTRSGRGRGGEAPLVLLNGRRIAGFREIRQFPPEALERVEVLPEEAALAYGARPNQRVVNFILRPSFAALRVQLQGGAPTAGGYGLGRAEAGLLRIRGDTRVSLDAEAERSGRLLESQRDVPPRPGAQGADDAAARTLIPATTRAELGGTLARPLSSLVSGTLSASYTRRESEALQGLSRSVETVAFARDSQTDLARLGLTLTGDDPRWRWTVTANAALDETRTSTERDPIDRNLAGVRAEEARASIRSLDLDATLNTRPLELPAGPLALSLAAGVDDRQLDSQRRPPDEPSTKTRLGRTIARARLSADMPIASPRENILPRLGTLSLNLNAGGERLSDFGTLRQLGAGLNWTPAPPLGLVVSWTDEAGAPGINQLGNPVLEIPNVRLFDQRTGQTVDAIRVEGGNPELVADRRQVWQARLTLRPLPRDLTFTLNLVDEQLTNPIRTLGALAPGFERVFPERFVRDEGGALVRFDDRPLNVARFDRQELRYGFSWFHRRGPAGASRSGRATMRSLAAGGVGPGGGGPGGGGPGGGGLQTSLFHTVRLSERLLIAPGIPALDLLNGGSAGSRGGVPRHEVEARIGGNLQGLGGRLQLNWRSATLADADPFSGAPSPLDLRFSPQATVDLRLFADLGRLTSAPLARNSRVSLTVDNLTNTRPLARDRLGRTPAGLSADLLDPRGRVVEIGLRKLFAPPAATRPRAVPRDTP